MIADGGEDRMARMWADAGGLYTPEYNNLVQSEGGGSEWYLLSIYNDRLRTVITIACHLPTTLNVPNNISKLTFFRLYAMAVQLQLGVSSIIHMVATLQLQLHKEF